MKNYIILTMSLLLVSTMGLSASEENSQGVFLFSEIIEFTDFKLNDTESRLKSIDSEIFSKHRTKNLRTFVESNKLEDFTNLLCVLLSKKHKTFQYGKVIDKIKKLEREQQSNYFDSLLRFFAHEKINEWKSIFSIYVFCYKKEIARKKPTTQEKEYIKTIKRKCVEALVSILNKKEQNQLYDSIIEIASEANALAQTDLFFSVIQTQKMKDMIEQVFTKDQKKNLKAVVAKMNANSAGFGW